MTYYMVAMDEPEGWPDSVWLSLEGAVERAKVLAKKDYDECMDFYEVIDPHQYVHSVSVEAVFVDTPRGFRGYKTLARYKANAQGLVEDIAALEAK